ncbi:ribonuclease H-like domain-containing protein [Aspergillus oleicola]
MTSLSKFPRRVLQQTEWRCDSFWISKSTGSWATVRFRSSSGASKSRDSTPYLHSFSSILYSNDYWKSSRRIAEMKRDFSQYASQTRAPLGELQNNAITNNTVQMARATKEMIGRRGRQRKQRRQISTSTNSEPKQWWSHRLYKNQDGKDITVHYCPTLAITEKVAQLFVNEPVLGFDMEWQMAATTYSSIQDNISVIQLASRDRIAIFHLSRFSPNLKLEDLVSPTLKRIIEDENILKCGVAIKGDCTRLRKFMDIHACGTFELSHLHKLITYCYTNPKLIDKYRVKLTKLAEMHLGLPLAKDVDVRCSDWSGALTTKQAHYAAADAFAGYMLFKTMDAKRKALDPIPPLPAFDELNRPIRITAKAAKSEPKKKVNDESDVADDTAESVKRVKRRAKSVEPAATGAEPVKRVVSRRAKSINSAEVVEVETAQRVDRGRGRPRGT